MMNAHFCAAVPNLRIMETDIDRLAWDHELVHHVPEIVDGHLVMPDRPGWGTEPNEEGLRAHPPKPLKYLSIRLRECELIHSSKPKNRADYLLCRREHPPRRQPRPPFALAP
jgi:hypothetical protein